MNKYCQQCGVKNDRMANFCQSCGRGFNGQATKTATRPTATTDDEEEVSAVPKIEKLDVEIVAPRAVRGERLGDIAFVGGDPFTRPKEKKMTRKQALEQFKKEAGGGPTKSIEIG